MAILKIWQYQSDCNISNYSIESSKTLVSFGGDNNCDSLILKIEVDISSEGIPAIHGSNVFMYQDSTCTHVILLTINDTAMLIFKAQLSPQQTIGTLVVDNNCCYTETTVMTHTMIVVGYLI